MRLRNLQSLAFEMLSEILLLKLDPLASCGTQSIEALKRRQLQGDFRI